MCAQKYTEIRGFVKDDRLKEINLYNVEDGSTHLYASTLVAGDGSFGFLFCPSKSGFYTLGNDQMDFVIYVKGNDKINIDILENKDDIYIEAENANEILYEIIEQYKLDFEKIIVLIAGFHCGAFHTLTKARFRYQTLVAVL